jgi:hypothetical protein
MNYSPRHRKQSRSFLPHQLLVRLSAIFAVLGLALGTSLVAAPAASADIGDTEVVKVYLDDRPDSGEDGNTWATDDLQRTTRITEISQDGLGHSHYVAVVSDVGTFTTIAGELTPQGDDADALLASEFTGNVKGGFTVYFTAASDFASFDASTIQHQEFSDTDPASSGNWVRQMFDGDVSFHIVSNFDGWNWTYRYRGQVYVQSADGYSGALTG